MPDLQVLAQRLAANNAWATDYLARFDPMGLCSAVSFVFTDRQHGTMTRQEILFYPIKHSTYHRGAIGPGRRQTPG